MANPPDLNHADSLMPKGSGTSDGLRLFAEEIAEIIIAKMGAAEMPVPKRLFTIAEAAQYVGMSEDGLRCKVNRNEVPVTRIDGRLRFDRLALDRWIEQNTHFEDER